MALPAILSSVSTSNRYGGVRRWAFSLPMRTDDGVLMQQLSGKFAESRSRSMDGKLHTSENHGRTSASIRRYHENQPV